MLPGLPVCQGQNERFVGLLGTEAAHGHPGGLQRSPMGTAQLGSTVPRMPPAWALPVCMEWGGALTCQLPQHSTAAQCLGRKPGSQAPGSLLGPDAPLASPAETWAPGVRCFGERAWWPDQKESKPPRHKHGAILSGQLGLKGQHRLSAQAGQHRQGVQGPRVGTTFARDSQKIPGCPCLGKPWTTVHLDKRKTGPVLL